MSAIPLSFGIPFGVVVTLVGGLLLVATKYKKIGWGVLGVGLAVSAATLALILLAVNSGM